MPGQTTSGSDLPEIVAAHILHLAPGDNHDPALFARHVTAICRWLEKCFPDDPSACKRRASEFATAFGLGARRGLPAQPRHKLDHVWPGSVAWLRQEIMAAVRQGLQLPLALTPRLSDSLRTEYEIAADLFDWLMFPALEDELDMGDKIDIGAFRDRVEIRSPQGPSRSVLPGQRRTFLLRSGLAKISYPGAHDGVRWHPGCFLIVRAGDFGASRIRLFPQSGKPVDLPFGAFQFASVQAEQFCSFEDLSCTCGRDTCSHKHRISAFDPLRLDLKATLRSFVDSAVRGALPKPTPKSFKGGMLYAWLANRPDSGALREVLLIRSRHVKNANGHYLPWYDAAESIIAVADCIPERRIRCAACSSLEPENCKMCEFCGSVTFRPAPITVWSYRGTTEGLDLNALEPFLTDSYPDPEERLIQMEEEALDVDWEGFARNDQPEI